MTRKKLAPDDELALIYLNETRIVSAIKTVGGRENAPDQHQRNDMAALMMPVHRAIRVPDEW